MFYLTPAPKIKITYYYVRHNPFKHIYQHPLWKRDYFKLINDNICLSNIFLIFSPSHVFNLKITYKFTFISGTLKITNLTRLTVASSVHYLKILFKKSLVLMVKGFNVNKSLITRCQQMTLFILPFINLQFFTCKNFGIGCPFAMCRKSFHRQLYSLVPSG